MRQSKYTQSLKQFYQVPFFTIEEAKRESIPRHVLAYLVKKGTWERIYPGVYRFPE